MAVTQPAYEGLVDQEGNLRKCRCDEPAAYSVTKTINGDAHTFDVCAPHFRVLSRNPNQPLTTWTEFNEYNRFIRRMRVWVKETSKPLHMQGGMKRWNVGIDG